MSSLRIWKLLWAEHMKYFILLSSTSTSNHWWMKEILICHRLPLKCLLENSIWNTKKNYICWKKVNFHNFTKQQSWEDTESNQNNIQTQEFPTDHFRFHSLTSWLEHWEECLIHHHCHHHHHPCHAHHEYHLHHHQDHLQRKRFWELIVNFTGKCFQAVQHHQTFISYSITIQIFIIIINTISIIIIIL